MKGGSITGNTAASNAGGVFVSNINDNIGSFTASGGTITGNNMESSSGLGGGVFVNTNSKISLSGDVQIQENWNGGTLNTERGVY